VGKAELENNCAQMIEKQNFESKEVSLWQKLKLLMNAAKVAVTVSNIALKMF
jgi:hypothetical protein